MNIARKKNWVCLIYIVSIVYEINYNQMEMYDYCVKNNSHLIFIVLPIINRSEIKVTYEKFC